MSVSVRVVLNDDGIKQLLRSQGVVDDLERRANAVAEAAGGAPDYVASVWQGKDRARGSVRTATAKGRSEEANNRTLTRSVDAARR